MKLIKCFDWKFGVNYWHLILFFEVLFLFFWLTKTLLAILFQDPTDSLPYSTILSIFFCIVFGVFVAPLQMGLLWKGINKRNPRCLKIYTIINTCFVTPCMLTFTIYLRWKVWTIRGDAKFEIILFLIGALIYVVLVYWRLPHHLRLAQLDKAAFMRLKNYIELYDFNQNNLEQDQKEELNPKIVSDLKKCVISSMDVSIDFKKIIGQGQFGICYKGHLCLEGKIFDVVGKTSKIYVANMNEILSEMRIALHIGSHQYIVHFYGITSIFSGEYYLLTEYCHGGDLHSYLGKLQPIYSHYCNYISSSQNDSARNYVNIYTTSIDCALEKIKAELLSYSQQIYLGMLHLSYKKIIHGDLAARNILLTENLQVKIADFGMSKKLYNYQLYAKNLQHDLLPWRWLSIEALEDLKFSEKSDVWAYGVTLFEIFSLGQLPFKEVDWNLNFVRELREGKLILSRPELCNEEMYTMMNQCWTLNCNERPCFKDLNYFL